MEMTKKKSKLHVCRMAVVAFWPFGIGYSIAEGLARMSQNGWWLSGLLHFGIALMMLAAYSAVEKWGNAKDE